MNITRRLGAYAAHGDPLTAACNRIALLVASGQPTYPLYVWWIVGGPWQAACWTFLSTPLFLSVPAAARRRGMAGRALLVVAGIANVVLSAKAFGVASGVAWFLVPTALITLLALGRLIPLMVAVHLAAWLALGHLGAPWGQFSAEQAAHFHRLNISSVAVLSAIIAWTLLSARRAVR